MATSRGCGQGCFTTSLLRAHRLLLPSYLIRTPVAGFIGLLLLVLLRGIRLLRQETSIRVMIRARLICLLQVHVFGFLGFYVLDFFSSASSSHVLICVFACCGFVLLFLVPSGVSVSFSVSSSVLHGWCRRRLHHHHHVSHVLLSSCSSSPLIFIFKLTFQLAFRG